MSSLAAFLLRKKPQGNRFLTISAKKAYDKKGTDGVPNLCINRFISRISKDRTQENRLSLANGKYQELSGYAPNLPRFQRIYRFAVPIPFDLFSIVAVLRFIGLKPTEFCCPWGMAYAIVKKTWHGL
jgi:hypothetical protein